MKPYTLNRKHVLLAEDDGDQSFLFGLILRQLDPGIRLSVVSNGDELLQFLKCNSVDLLFLDLNMPCKGGFECLCEIKSNQFLKELPVVVYSSSTHMNDIQRSYASNADLYMVKPFNGNYLKEALNLILQLDWKQEAHSKYYFMNNRFVLYTA
jgi:CheY-like chemotaxis protein